MKRKKIIVINGEASFSERTLPKITAKPIPNKRRNIKITNEPAETGLLVVKDILLILLLYLAAAVYLPGLPALSARFFPDFRSGTIAE